MTLCPRGAVEKADSRDDIVAAGARDAEIALGARGKRERRRGDLHDLLRSARRARHGRDLESVLAVQCRSRSRESLRPVQASDRQGWLPAQACERDPMRSCRSALSRDRAVRRPSGRSCPEACPRS